MLHEKRHIGKRHKEGLHAFRGVMRRFEDRGTCNGARLIHDYAHHPQEVAATILAAQPIEKKTACGWFISRRCFPAPRHSLTGW